jgi:hypothetical protein
VVFHQLADLVLKRTLLVVLFLPVDVADHVIDLRLADAERALATLPTEIRLRELPAKPAR